MGPRPSSGETLHERSKGKDVRISNIVAAKVRYYSRARAAELRSIAKQSHTVREGEPWLDLSIGIRDGVVVVVVVDVVIVGHSFSVARCPCFVTRGVRGGENENI